MTGQLLLARAARIEDIIAERRIKLSSGRVERCGPCPVCGGRDRFSVNLAKQVFNCRICGAKGHGAIDLVMFLDGSGFKETVAALAGAAAGHRDHKPPDDDTARKAASAGRIWRESIDPRETLVETYLASRSLELPAEAANEAIRFHPDCFMDGEHRPAMVCLVRNIKTNEPQAIHRTALAADGTAIKRKDWKTFRMSLGPITGGAIKLDPDEDVTRGLCIGEGVETCLSGQQMGLRPVWAVMSTTGVKTFPVLPGIDGLHIFRENDAAKDVEECAQRWYDAGRDVIIIDPDIGSDLNDELREAAR